MVFRAERKQASHSQKESAIHEYSYISEVFAPKPNGTADPIPNTIQPYGVTISL